MIEVLVPHVLAALALIPAVFLPPGWQWVAYPICASLYAFGWWLIWPRWP